MSAVSRSRKSGNPSPMSAGKTGKPLLVLSFRGFDPKGNSGLSLDLLIGLSPRPRDRNVVSFLHCMNDPQPEGHMASYIARRKFLATLGGAAVARPLAVRAQQPAMPVVGIVTGRSPDVSARHVAAFRKGLSETGYVEGENVVVEYHWLEGQYDRLPSLMADLVRRRVALIATPGNNPAALAAKAATTAIPIVFGVGGDPVRMGLVASLARPGGNATGINIFVGEVAAKRLGLLHELVPKAVRVAVLVNPANAPTTEAILRDIPEAARIIGLQIQVLNASTSREIEAALHRPQSPRF